MGTAQPGIFAFGTRVHHYLELDVEASVEPAALAAALDELRSTDVTTGGTNGVVAFGPDLWRRIAPDGAPRSMRAATPIEGPAGHRAPATQHDIWVWIHGGTTDAVVERTREVVRCLGPVATVALEQPAFTYLDSRDLTGFVDGTENPPLGEAHLAALVPDGEVGAGGSHLLTMRFEHDLDSFRRLSEPDQERVFGRTKRDSIELDDAHKPADAHISRVVVEGDHGEELEVFRRSTPIGGADDAGLYFVAFSTEPGRVDRMLERMYGLAPDGLHDHLLDFTSATTLARWFVPSLEALAGLSAAGGGDA